MYKIQEKNRDGTWCDIAWTDDKKYADKIISALEFWNNRGSFRAKETEKLEDN